MESTNKPSTLSEGADTMHFLKSPMVGQALAADFRNRLQTGEARNRIRINSDHHMANLATLQWIVADG